MDMGGFTGFGASIPAWSAGIQHEKNKRENKRAREWELHMWNLQNEYNKPINIRKRMEEGGINPMLAFGGQMVQATTAGSSTPHQGAQMTGLPEAVASGVGMVQQGLMNQEQIKQMDKQNKLIDAQIAQTYTDTFKKAADTANSWQQYDFATKAQADNLRNIKAQADQATTTAGNLDEMQKSEIAQKKAQTEQTLLQNKWIDKRQAAEIANLNATLQAQLITNKNLDYRQISEVYKIQAEIDQIATTTAKIDVERKIKEWEARLANAGLTPSDLYPLRAMEMTGEEIDKKLKTGLHRKK